MKNAEAKLKKDKLHLPKTRLIAGAVVFMAGFLMPLLVPVVARMNIPVGLKTTISGLLLLGIPELFMFITIAIMGKEGYNFLKAKVFEVFRKYGPPQQVSRLRYRIGLLMFCLPLAVGWLLPYFDHLLPDFENYELYINIGGDILLLISLFVLGGEFWDKIRSLFIYNQLKKS